MRPQVRVLLWGLVAAGLALSVLPRALHAGSLTELNDIEQLRWLFNQDEKIPRVVLLLSPT